MKKKTSAFPYILIGITLLFLMSFKKETQDSLKSPFISTASIFWQKSNSFKSLFLKVPTIHSKSDKSNIYTQVSMLSKENKLLHAQLEAVSEWLLFENRLDEQVERLNSLKKFQGTTLKGSEAIYWKDFFQRRSFDLKNLLEKQMQSLPAKVIFRQPSSWGSSLWINVGEENNKSLEAQIVAKNSVVVLGSSLIGLVEKVEEKKSRVRLITDSGLIPSVRAIRGKEQNRALHKNVNDLLIQLKNRADLFKDKTEQKMTLLSFHQILDKLKKRNSEHFMAKGEVFGSSHPLWKCKNNILNGIGFNCDFEDEDMPKRDLKTSNLINENSFHKKKMPVISIGDLLVTTGLDGIFPKGLHVGIVTHTSPIKNGDYAYKIKAIPTAKNLNNLNIVFVMPPEN
jgi:rod shape-determining protein MreC